MFMLSPTLKDNLLLLLSTAAISGILVPFVLKQIDQQRAERQRQSDANRTRQEKLIESQAAFLDRLTEKLWKWRYICIKVTYYGGQGDQSGYDAANKAYSEQFWLVLNEIRIEISKAHHLLSPAVLEKLRTFYTLIVNLDRELLSVSTIADISKRQILYMDLNYKIFSAITDTIDSLLNIIASDLQLKKVTVQL